MEIYVKALWKQLENSNKHGVYKIDNLYAFARIF